MKQMQRLMMCIFAAASCALVSASGGELAEPAVEAVGFQSQGAMFTALREHVLYCSPVGQTPGVPVGCVARLDGSMSQVSRDESQRKRMASGASHGPGILNTINIFHQKPAASGGGV